MLNTVEGMFKINLKCVLGLQEFLWELSIYCIMPIGGEQSICSGEALEISEEAWQASKCYEFTIAILNKARCSCPAREMITASCNQIKGSYFRQSWNTNRKTWTVAQTQDPGYTLCKYNWLVEIKCIHVQLMHVYRNRVFFFLKPSFPFFSFIGAIISSVVGRSVSFDESHFGCDSCRTHSLAYELHKGRAQLRPFEPNKKIIF